MAILGIFFQDIVSDPFTSYTHGSIVSEFYFLEIVYGPIATQAEVKTLSNQKWSAIAILSLESKNSAKFQKFVQTPL